MTTLFTRDDRQFLKQVGIADDTPLAAKPSTFDLTMEFMREHGLPLTRENYLLVAYLGNPPKELAETEAEIPRELF
jgi:hypothetical protein